jgi:hypothetical protein
MEYNILSCGSSQSNTGSKQCIENFQDFSKFIITPLTFEFATQAAAELLANWTTAINAAAGSRIYPFPTILEKEDLSEATLYKTFTSGIQKKIREGKRGYRFTVQVPLCVHQALRTFNGYNGRFIGIDNNGRILGTSPDGAKFKGWKLDTFEVEKIMIPSGDDICKTTIYVLFSDTTEFDDYGASFRPADLVSSWNPLDLDGLQDVTLAITDSSATGATLTVTTTCDLIPVVGLVLADLVMTDDAGGAETITGATDNSDGTYTLTWSTISADTYWVDLLAPSAMTTKGYESTGYASFVIT